MAYLHQPISLTTDTYGSLPENMSADTLPSPTYYHGHQGSLASSQSPNPSPQRPFDAASHAPVASKPFEAYSPAFNPKAQERGQMPLVLVDSCSTGADLRSFEDDDTETSLTRFNIVGREGGGVRVNEARAVGDDIAVGGEDDRGDGYGANVRSVAAYYRMPIQTPALPLVPISAVAGGSDPAGFSNGHTVAVVRPEMAVGEKSDGFDSVCYICHQPLPTSSQHSQPCNPCGRVQRQKSCECSMNRPGHQQRHYGN